MRPLVVSLIASLGLFSLACSEDEDCTVPVREAKTFTGTLAPLAARTISFDVASAARQISLSVTAAPGLAVWQVDANCPESDVERCPVVGGSRDPRPLPAGAVAPCCSVLGRQAVFVVKNTLADRSLDYSLFFQPYRTC